MPARLFSLTLLFAAATLAGCGSSTTPAAKDDKATLSDADKALVEKQKLCIVADGALGSMGTPVKVTVKGKDVFLCCEHCREALLKDPDKYLAKLDANGTVVPEAKTDEAPKTDAAPAPAPTAEAAPQPK
jgi:hypothetical protein